MNEIDSHLQKLPLAEKAALERIRAIVLSIAPSATEVITYGMPGFKYKNKYLIAYGAFKDHLSIFPGAGAIATLKDELANYHTSKGTVQFTLEKPLPDELIKRILALRLNDINAQ